MIIFNKILYISLFLYIFDYVNGGVSSVENKFIYYQTVVMQDTSIKSKTEYKNSTIFKDEKSISKAMLMSVVIPGTGQLYLGKWKRAVIYGLVEALAISHWYKYDDYYNQGQRQYRDLATQNWSFSRWIKDYYKWSDSNNEYNDIFIDQDEYYPSISDGSHYVSFHWDPPDASYHKFIKTTDDHFRDVYMYLCGTTGLSICLDDIQDIDSKVQLHNIDIIKDHNFYENIGKYDSFFAGWIDNAEIYLYEKNTGELLAYSPQKWHYRKNLFEKAEEYYAIAGYAMSLLLTNHVVSAVDALLTAKLDNNMNLTISPYYDSKNKWGVGGFKFSFKI